MIIRRGIINVPRNVICSILLVVAVDSGVNCQGLREDADGAMESLVVRITYLQERMKVREKLNWLASQVSLRLSEKKEDYKF